MSKKHIDIGFICFLLVFILLFISSSINFEINSTETINWTQGKFTLTIYSNLSLIAILITLFIYSIIRKR